MKSKKLKIILASQECNFSGAAMLISCIAAELNKRNCKIIIICNKGGPLLKGLFQYGAVFVTESKFYLKILLYLAEKIGYRSVLTNTTMSGHIACLAAQSNIKVVSLIHELPGVINSYNAKDRAIGISKYSSKIIFPNYFVKNRFIERYPTRESKIKIKGQGFYKKFSNSYSTSDCRKLRKQLLIPEKNKVIIGVGMGDKRKGLDLFVEIAKQFNKQKENASFIWIGDVAKSLKWVERSGKKENVIFIKNTNFVEKYYRIADLLLMTSREDPFPSVVLEAIYCGVPVIGFDEAGGFRELPEEYISIVPYENILLMSKKAKDILQNEEYIQFIKKNGMNYIKENYSFSNYVTYILKLLELKY